VTVIIGSWQEPFTSIDRTRRGGAAGSIWGDKAYSTVFDNSKTRSLVPGYQATTSFSLGIRAAAG
jgi:hypothetical protein